MSQDFKIQNICDHRIYREKATLRANRKDILLVYPIASETSCKVYVDGSEVAKEDYEIITISDNRNYVPKRLIRMKRRIRNQFPLVEVDYLTVLERCPKCLGVSVVDDIRISTDGDVALVKDEGYLVQQVEKFIVTQIGSNTFHNWMGTDLQSLIGTKVADIDLINSRVTNQINTAVNKLIDLQEQQIAAGRVMTPGELYGTTLGISVEETGDYSVFEVTLSFTARSGKTIEYSQLLELSQFRQRLGIV